MNREYVYSLFFVSIQNTYEYSSYSYPIGFSLNEGNENMCPVLFINSINDTLILIFLLYIKIICNYYIS